MRSSPRVFFALSVSVAFLLGGYACGDGTFPNKLSVYDPDAGGVVTYSEDSSVPQDAADAHASADAGDAASAKDAAGGDAGDAGSATDGAAPLDAGDAGLGEGGLLEDASGLDGAGATG